jgi:hypothetical protein
MQVCERMVAEGGIVTLPVQIFAAEAAFQDDGSEYPTPAMRPLPKFVDGYRKSSSWFGWELD